MGKENKGRNYLSTKQIIEMLKWAYNNEDVNFLYMGVYDWLDTDEKFIESKAISLKDKKNTLVATNLTAFINEMLTELGWKSLEYEENEEYVLGCDIGVAHTQDIKNNFADRYNKTSKFIAFKTGEELLDFVKEVTEEIRIFINSHTINEVNNELELTVDRINTLKDKDDFEFLLSEDDMDMIEGMPKNKKSLSVHKTKNKLTKEDDIVIIDKDNVM